MLLHITHHQDESTCPAHDEEAGNALFGAVLTSLQENVDQIIGAWVDAPGHECFLVVGTNEVSQIFAGLWPIIPAGTAKIQPVADFAKMLEARAATVNS